MIPVIPYARTARQQGFMMLEALLALSIGLAVTTSWVFYKKTEADQTSAEIYGRRIAEYSNAVRSALVADGATFLAGGTTRSGVNWLKTNDGTCSGGTATQAYLPCGFTAYWPFGIDLTALPVANNTILTTNGAASPLYTGTTVFPGVTVNGVARPDLTGMAAQAAMRFGVSAGQTTVTGGAITFTPNTAANTITAVSTNGTGAGGQLQATTVAVAGTACSPNGLIAQDSTGALLSCQNGVWATQGGGFWKAPVATYAALPTSGNTIGDVRNVTALSRAFTWNGTKWSNLGVDENGSLAMTGTMTAGKVMAIDTVVAGAACSPNGLVAQDGTGLLLSCQASLWTRTAGFRTAPTLGTVNSACTGPGMFSYDSTGQLLVCRYGADIDTACSTLGATKLDSVTGEPLVCQ